MAGRTMIVTSVSMLRTATLLLIWAAWEALARSGLLYEGVVPSSAIVIPSILQHLGDPAFYGHVMRTANEVLGGFAIGSLTGIAAGIGFGARRFVDRAAAPYIHGFASTPKIVFLPILMLMFGVGIGSKIGMAAFSSFFPVTIAVAAGMLSVDPVLVRVARGFNATPLQIVAKIYLPSLVRPAVTGMRLGLGVAIVGTLLAEIKFSNQGLGHLAIQHYNFFRVADMYAVLLLTFALAVAANSLMGWIGDRLVRHR